jgi:hypothetical protein
MDNPPFGHRSAANYRGQAAELRRLAVKEPENSTLKTQLLEVAKQYDRLAERAEERGN